MLAYVDAIVRENTITVDGYTTNKTERGIIKDVARAIEKYDQDESSFLLEMLKMGIDEYNDPFVKAANSDGGYFLSMKKYHVPQDTMKKLTRWNIKKDIITIFVLDLYDKQTRINDKT